MVDFRYAQRYTVSDLERIMALLRGPDGCPWDREQTHASIRRNMIEEAYEAAQAIDLCDDENLREELGDVLLQVVFHARMAQERGSFTFDDVVDGICKKLIFRHPHIFGDTAASSAQDALHSWEARKQQEKGQTAVADTMDSVAQALPALMRADKIQAKAHRAGFDWPDAERALDKIDEELAELRRAAQDGTNVEEELGDLLFAAVKAGRFLGVESEQALHAACEKFIARFRAAERLAHGVPMTEMALPALEELWRRAKLETT